MNVAPSAVSTLTYAPSSSARVDHVADGAHIMAPGQKAPRSSRRLIRATRLEEFCAVHTLASIMVWQSSQDAGPGPGWASIVGRHYIAATQYKSTMIYYLIMTDIIVTIELYYAI